MMFRWEGDGKPDVKACSRDVIFSHQLRNPYVDNLLAGIDKCLLNMHPFWAVQH